MLVLLLFMYFLRFIILFDWIGQFLHLVFKPRYYVFYFTLYIGKVFHWAFLFRHTKFHFKIYFRLGFLQSFSLYLILFIYPEFFKKNHLTVFLHSECPLFMFSLSYLNMSTIAMLNSLSCVPSKLLSFLVCFLLLS